MRDEYEVGYKKPPKHTRFKSGKSGNPKGRPKGSKNIQTLINQRLNKKTSVVEKGRRKEITMGELIIAKLVNDAAAGDSAARRDVLKLMGEIKEGADQKGYTIIYLDEADRNA